MLFIEFIIGFIVIMIATFGGFILLAVGAIATTVFIYSAIQLSMESYKESRTSGK